LTLLQKTLRDFFSAAFAESAENFREFGKKNTGYLKISDLVFSALNVFAAKSY